MEKWSEQRINAYKRYVENDKMKIKVWEISLQEHFEGVERAKEMIELHEQSMYKTIKELAEQGIYL